jgi:hypothetical protein
MLLTLLVFHMYWWKLIFNMILKQLSNKGQVGEDVRSGNSFVISITLFLVTLLKPKLIGDVRLSVG